MVFYLAVYGEGRELFSPNGSAPESVVVLGDGYGSSRKTEFFGSESLYYSDYVAVGPGGVV